MLPGRFLAADLAACQVVATVDGKKVKITKNAAGSVMVNDGTATASVTTADLAADNGVVHSIDRVLAVPTDDSTLECDSTTAAGAAAAASTAYQSSVGASALTFVVVGWLS